MELQKKVNRRTLVAGGVAAAAALGGVATWFMSQPKDGEQLSLKAGRFSGDLPVANPEDQAWSKAKAVKVPLLAQQMFYPRLKQATLPHLTVRSLWNGAQLGVLIEWQDEKTDDLESIVTFRDAVAIMLPVDPTADRPPVFMGMDGRPVYILQWKASWQRDVEHGFQDVEKSYPNWFNDMYPGHPDLEQFGMKGEAVKPFYPGLAVGNPLSQQQRKSPMEELTAVGYGSLTSLPEQRAQGKGVFADGRWKVAMGVPAGGSDVPALNSGQTVQMAFACWDGGHRQVGGRKHYADWIQVHLPT